MAAQTTGTRHELRLTLQQARSLQLAAMGLLESPTKVASKDDVLSCIRSMNVLQIDTIHIVARSPYLVLWSRLGHYAPDWLDELLSEGRIFEYWAHAACFLPIEDYPHYRRQMLHLEAAGFECTAMRLASDPVAHLELVELVRECGPVRASDFEHEDGRSGTGWWGWKPDKLRLETLFTAGEIMVSRRENFHRIYDVRERVLPRAMHDDTLVPDRDEVDRLWTLAAVKALGITPARWIGDYFRHAGRVARPHPDQLVRTGELLRVGVDGWPWLAYVHPDHAQLLRAAQRDRLHATHCTLLSPFDPLVWDRDRALAMFNFDYRIECYTPEAKRKYGYFSLPILIRDRIVGRLDAKAHRSEGVFEIRSLHLEDGIDADAALAEDVAGAVRRCAQWHALANVSVTRSSPRRFAPMLRRALRSLSA